jgi:hypothetical protein
LVINTLYKQRSENLALRSPTPSRSKGHARALYSCKYRHNSVFDTIHTYTRETQSKPNGIHLIVYQWPREDENWNRVHSIDNAEDGAAGLNLWKTAIP